MHSGWIGLQIYPSSRLEVFGSATWNAADATIADFSYDAGALTSVLVGLDYALQSQSMAGFSDLDFRQVAVSAGINYRVTNHAIFTSTLSINDLDDNAPYLVDVAGKYVNVFAGVRWLF